MTGHASLPKVVVVVVVVVVVSGVASPSHMQIAHLTSALVSTPLALIPGSNWIRILLLSTENSEKNSQTVLPMGVCGVCQSMSSWQSSLPAHP